jgi:dihydroorotase
MSTAPAAIAGIEAGTLAIGAPADVTIIAPDELWTIDAQRFCSLCQSSPHDGDQVRGRVVYTIVEGDIRYKRRPALEHLATSGGDASHV